MSKKKKKNKRKKQIQRLVILLIFLLLVLAGVVFYLFGSEKGIRISKRTVNGYDVRDYSQSEMKKLLEDDFKWDIHLVDKHIDISLDNAIQDKIDDSIEKAYSMHRGFQLEIKLSDSDVDAVVKDAIAKAQEYEVSADDSSDIMKYDKDSDSFVYSDKVLTTKLDKKTLRKDLTDALKQEHYQAKIKLIFDKSYANVSSADFQLIGTYETTTTANSNRNTNIQNACDSVNGTVLLPGQKFSYNEALGERTDEKGYKTAGAYLNGEHVDQIGGGICQVSSTLFNAVFAANLKVEERHGHTFEPSYVKPGTDATVSYPKPDFQFVNNSGYPIGILAHYNDRHVLVEIYGVPTLEEGVKRYMTTEKVESYDMGMVFEDNPALAYGQQQITKNSKPGSKWITNEVLEKDGEVISTKQVYVTKYKGETGILQRNLTLDNMVNAQNGLPPVVSGQAVPAQPAVPQTTNPESPVAGEVVQTPEQQQQQQQQVPAQQPEVPTQPATQVTAPVQ